LKSIPDEARSEAISTFIAKGVGVFAQSISREVHKRGKGFTLDGKITGRAASGSALDAAKLRQLSNIRRTPPRLIFGE